MTIKTLKYSGRKSIVFILFIDLTYVSIDEYVAVSFRLERESGALSSCFELGYLSDYITCPLDICICPSVQRTEFF